jgi:hypothetical protein
MSARAEVDPELVQAVIERDWGAFVAQSTRLGLDVPSRAGTDVFVPVRPKDSTEMFFAVLSCDDYDLVAPLLDFADPQDRDQRGAKFWPRMAAAPMNSIVYEEKTLPIICTPGTRGYHLHPSHSAENWPATTWRLPRVASLLWRFTYEMGPYGGRGV